MFRRIAEKFKEQTPTTQAFIILIILLLIGIAVRWESIIDGVKAGFDFFNSGNGK